MKYPVKEVGLRHVDWAGLILTTDMPKEGKLLVLYLARFMNRDQHVAWPSFTRIKHECSMARSTVGKYLKLLESEGWIRREKGNSTTSSRYHIAFPKCLERGIEKISGSSTDELGSTPDVLRSTPDELGVVRQTYSNRILNRQTNRRTRQKPESGFALPDTVDPEAWAMWDEYRSAGKKSREWTDRAKTIAANRLKGLPPKIQRQTVEDSIGAGWTGLFPKETKAPKKEDIFAGMI